MKRLNKLGLMLGVGAMCATSFTLSACGDDTVDRRHCRQRGLGHRGQRWLEHRG